MLHICIEVILCHLKLFNFFPSCRAYHVPSGKILAVKVRYYSNFLSLTFSLSLRSFLTWVSFPSLRWLDLSLFYCVKVHVAYAGKLQYINPVSSNEHRVPRSQVSPSGSCRFVLTLRVGTTTSSWWLCGQVQRQLWVVPLGQTPSSSWWRSCFTFPKPGVTATGMERSQGVSLYSALLLPQCPQGHILECSLQPLILNKENFPIFFGILLCFPRRFCGFNRLVYFNVLPPCPPLCLYNWIYVCVYLPLAFVAVKLYSVVWLRVSDKYQSSLKLN